jgi:hypothetical protein
LENTPRGEEKNISQCHLGENYVKAKRKRGKYNGKRHKGESKIKKGERK